MAHVDGIDEHFRPPVDYTDEVEMKLRSKQLDFVIIYAQADKNDAEDIKNKLTSISIDGKPLDGVLYDEACPFETWKYSAAQEQRKDLFGRSTFKFFLISDNLADDYDLIQQKNEAVEHSLKHRDQTVTPLWLVGKRDLDDDAFDTLHGFMSLQGLDPNVGHFTKRVEQMAKMAMFVEHKKKRISTQESKLRGYLKDKKQKLSAQLQAQVQSDPSKLVYTADKTFWEQFIRRGNRRSATNQGNNSLQPSSTGSLETGMEVDEGPSSNESINRTTCVGQQATSDDVQSQSKMASNDVGTQGQGTDGGMLVDGGPSSSESNTDSIRSTFQAQQPEQECPKAMALGSLTYA